MPQEILDVVTKNPQIEHVKKKVRKSSMQEHGGKNPEVGG